MAGITSSGSGTDQGMFKLVTGPVKVAEVVINPSLKELNDYGVPFKTEPAYDIEDSERGKGVAIDFWFKVDGFTFNHPEKGERELKDGEIVLNHRVFCYNQIKKSQGGNTQYINKYGRFVYAENKESIPDWFDKDGIREAFVGEEDLILFIRNWGDVRKQDECMLAAPDKLFTKDFSELKVIQDAWNTHKLIALLGIKDGGEGKFRQVVYNKEFWRVYADTVNLKVDGEWQNIPFETGLKPFLEQEYKEFTRADWVSYIPKIHFPNELNSVTPTPEEPHKEEEPGAETKEDPLF